MMYSPGSDSPDGGAFPDDLTRELDPDQIQALEILLAGDSVTDAANAVGVDRTTVSRWRNHDRHFIAALNWGKRLFLSRVRQELLKIVWAAVAAVRLEISEGNAQLAFRLLCEMDVLGPEPLEVGSSDPYEVRTDRPSGPTSEGTDFTADQRRHIRGLFESLKDVEAGDGDETDAPQGE